MMLIMYTQQLLSEEVKEGNYIILKFQRQIILRTLVKFSPIRNPNPIN